MKELNRPIMKDNQYVNILDINDQVKINNMVNTIQDKLQLPDLKLREVQAALRTDLAAGHNVSEMDVEEVMEPFDPDSMGVAFVCPNAERCKQMKKRNWQSMMQHAWSNSEAWKIDNNRPNCYAYVSAKEKKHYDNFCASKKSKKQKEDDPAEEVQPTYDSLPSLALLDRLRKDSGRQST